jgi:lipopolysaccharide export system protein LptC
MNELRIYLIIALLGLVTWEWVQWNQESDVTVKIAENSPDFFSIGYYKQQMDSDGVPKNELFADKMQHFKVDATTNLEKPIMTLFNTNGQAPWLIKAETGVMAADGDNLLLKGSTQISREASKSAAALTINTADLHVKLQTSYAETQAWTELISPPHKTTGTGMEVTFTSPIHLKLLAMVKGRYELK